MTVVEKQWKIIDLSATVTSKHECGLVGKLIHSVGYFHKLTGSTRHKIKYKRCLCKFVCNSVVSLYGSNVDFDCGPATDDVDQWNTCNSAARPIVDSLMTM